MELRRQYGIFLKRLEEFVLDKDIRTLDSKDLIKTFLSSKIQMYRGIELIMYIICTGCVVVSVESIIESMVSMYEYRSSKIRNIDFKRANMEMMLGWNGPPPMKSEAVIKEAMENYWKEKKVNWHFHRSDKNIKDWIISKAVDNNVLAVKNKFPFME